jgi:hypothetical protein
MNLTEKDIERIADAVARKLRGEKNKPSPSRVAEIRQKARRDAGRGENETGRI